jgi:protocatechuate 3,4-dioxygenase beta subunit
MDYDPADSQLESPGDNAPRISRRRLLEGSAAASVALAIGACDDDGGGIARTETGPRTEAERARLTPTPACDDGDEPTRPQTEGPFYSPDTPRRRSLLEDGLPGERLALAGVVVDTRCRAVPRALLDFWQADANGDYDTEGFRLRGHQFTDRRGRYRLETIVPALYTGRTRHIHVKAQRPGGEVLTTQLYFPGEPANRSDPIFDAALLMNVRDAGTARRATFTFVLA